MLRSADGSIGLWRDESVSHRKIVFAQVLVVILGVLAKARIVLAEISGAGSVTGHGAIQVIGHAAHHAEVGVGAHFHGSCNAFQFLYSVRNHEGAAYFVTGRGRLIQALWIGPLKIVKCRQALDAVAKVGMAGGVFDLFTVVPDVRRIGMKSFEDLLTAAGSDGLADS